MKLTSRKMWAGYILTFIILFLMTYIGNEQTDRLQRALLTAISGVFGLAIGTYFYRKKDEFPEKFD